MRKMALLLAAILLFVCCSAVSAEEAKDSALSWSVENNLLVLQITLSADDPGEWSVDVSEDSKVIALQSENADEKTATFTFSPVGDGWDEIDVLHTVNSVCDEMYYVSAEVEGGKFEGAYTAHYMSPEKSRINPYFIGEWCEFETQFHTMTITDDGDSGWNMQIVSPMTHGAFMFTANTHFDTMDYALSYTDGAIYNLPVTDEENAAPGDLVQDHLAGQVYMDVTSEADGEMMLIWQNPLNHETVTFLRSDDKAPDVLVPEYVDAAGDDTLPDGIYWADIEPEDLKAGKPMDVIFYTIDVFSGVDIQQISSGEMIFRDYKMYWVESTEDNGIVNYTEAATRRSGTMQFVGIPGTDESVAIDVSNSGLPMFTSQDIFDAPLTEDAKLLMITGNGPDIQPVDREAMAEELKDDDAFCDCTTVVRLQNGSITEVRHYKDIPVPDMMADVRSLSAEK